METERETDIECMSVIRKRKGLWRGEKDNKDGWWRGEKGNKDGLWRGEKFNKDEAEKNERVKEGGGKCRCGAFKEREADQSPGVLITLELCMTDTEAWISIFLLSSHFSFWSTIWSRQGVWGTGVYAAWVSMCPCSIFPLMWDLIAIYFTLMTVYLMVRFVTSHLFRLLKNSGWTGAHVGQSPVHPAWSELSHASSLKTPTFFSFSFTGHD